MTLSAGLSIYREIGIKIGGPEEDTRLISACFSIDAQRNNQKYSKQKLRKCSLYQARPDRVYQRESKGDKRPSRLPAQK